MRLAAIVCFASLCTAQTAGDADSEIERIRAKVNEVVAGIPNYTCVENVERSRRHGRAGRFGNADRVRIEVAEAGGKELFAPLGAKHFDNNGLPPAGSAGVVSNGEFVQYLRAIFDNTATQFQNHGKEDLEGAPCLRYDYIVPQGASDFRISRLGKSSFVSFHGSVWVDAESLDLTRIEVVADQIPAELGVVTATTDIVYAPFRIGENRFLLPQTSALVTVTNEAYDFRNDTEFTHCRQYAGTSSISFDDSDQSKTEVLDERDITAGMHLKLALASPLELPSARVGDSLAAVVTAEGDWKGKVLIPAGAHILGRIRRIEKNADQPRRIAMTLEFSEIESPTFRARFFAELQSVHSNLGHVQIVRDAHLAGAGIATLAFDEAATITQSNLQMIWATAAMN